MDEGLRELERRLRANPGDEELFARAVAARARAGVTSGLAWPPEAGTRLGPWRIVDIVGGFQADDRSGRARVAQHAERAAQATLRLARVEPDPERDARAMLVASLVRDWDPDLAALWGQEGEVEWAVEILWGDPGWLDWRWPDSARPLASPRQAVETGLELARALIRLRGVGLPSTWVTPCELVRARSGKVGLCWDPPVFSPRRTPEEYHAPRPGRRMGLLPGNPMYASPEVVGCTELGAPESMDIHAVGAMLHEALCGRAPVPGYSTTIELVRNILERPAPPLLERRPDLDPQLAGLVDLCLTRDPTRRWPATAQALAEELERWLRGEPLRLPRQGALGRLWSGLRGR